MEALFTVAVATAGYRAGYLIVPAAVIKSETYVRDYSRLACTLLLTLASSVVSVISTNLFSVVLSRFRYSKQPATLCSLRRNATLTLLPSLLANNAAPVSLSSATPLFPLPPVTISSCTIDALLIGRRTKRVGPVVGKGHVRCSKG